jgi:REP element-mobilizing transposase RayT
MKYHDKFHSDRYYHIYNHAVGNENLFITEENYSYFLNKYSHYAYPVVKTIAYNLLPNHFHCIIKIRDTETLIQHCKELIKLKNENNTAGKGNLKRLTVYDEEKFNAHEFVMQQFKNMFSGYAQAINKQQKRKGALFLDYLKRKEVNNESYLRNLITYVHYNVVHHGLCKKADDWKYSSYRIPLSSAMTKLERETILQLFETKEGYKNYHQDFKDLMDDDLEFR